MTTIWKTFFDRFYFDSFQEYPPSVHNMSEVFLALVAALNESSGADRTVRFVLDLIAPQLHGLDLTHVWNLENPMGYLVQVNKALLKDHN